MSYVKKPNKNDFTFHKHPGYYEHKKDKYFCCQRCFDIEGKVSKLSQENLREYICRACGQIYRIR